MIGDDFQINQRHHDTVVNVSIAVGFPLVAFVFSR